MKEQGLSGLEVETWYGAFAPAGTPSTVVSKVNGEINSLLRDTEILQLLSKQGMTPAGGPPERLGELVKRELERWTRVVNAAGIKAD
jgi:tripartite-type tricarboxylate transporter receptor subunit TctC